MEQVLTSLNWLKIFEVIATISGILCVFLQTRERIEAWFFGIVSVSLLSVVFYYNRLFSDVFLHLILLLLNVYGWYFWLAKKEGSDKVNIKEFLPKHWLMVLLIIVLMTPAWGYLMKTLFAADLAYLDAFTTVGSLVAQFLLAKKYLENWIVWIVVDIVGIGVYLYKDLYFVAFLFFVYLILCLYGWIQWKREVNLKGIYE